MIVSAWRVWVFMSKSKRMEIFYASCNRSKSYREEIKMYKLSECVHIVDGKNSKVAFNDYNFKVIDLSEDLYSRIQKIKDYEDEIVENIEEFTYLINNNFIVKSDRNELLERDKKIEFIRKKIAETGDSSIGYMRVSLTEQCNLRCKYCFVNEIISDRSNMSEEMFRKAVETLISGSKSPRIQYFGGEPLIRMELIILGHQMLSTAQKYGHIDNFTEEIVTNGTLLTEDKMNFFIENNIALIFSIDGWKEIHDKNRVNIQGNGTFDIVIEKFLLFKDKGGKAEMIITPNEDNIDILDQVIEFLVETYHITSVSINAPQPNEKGWSIDGKKLAKKVINSYLYCEERDIHLSAPGMNLVYNLLRNRYQIFSCTNVGTLKHRKWGLYLLGTGEVSYCNVERSKSSCESFDNFMITERFDEWHLKNNRTEKCKKCLAYSVCIGPCSMEKLMIGNEKILNNKCMFNRTIVKWALTR